MAIFDQQYNIPAWSPDDLHVRIFAACVDNLKPAWWNHNNLGNSYWRLYQNSTDGAWVIFDEKKIPLAGGELYFIPAGVQFSSRNINEITHLYIHFDIIGLPYIALSEVFSEPIHIPSTVEMRNEAMCLRRQLAAGDTLDLMKRCRIKALLYDGLWRYLDSIPEQSRDRCWQRVSDLAPVWASIEYIETHYYDHLTNKILADQCHMSEDHFIRRFRQCVGYSPAQYVTERRLAFAAQHLLFSRLSIDKIAEITGFGNRHYFSRVFARHLGEAPASFRKRVRT